MWTCDMPVVGPAWPFSPSHIGSVVAWAVNQAPYFTTLEIPHSSLRIASQCSVGCVFPIFRRIPNHDRPNLTGSFCRQARIHTFFLNAITTNQNRQHGRLGQSCRACGLPWCAGWFTSDIFIFISKAQSSYVTYCLPRSIAKGFIIQSVHLPNYFRLNLVPNLQKKHTL